MKIIYKSDPADREKARRMIARVQTLVQSPAPVRKLPFDTTRGLVASRNLEGTRLKLTDDDDNDGGDLESMLPAADNDPDVQQAPPIPEIKLPSPVKLPSPPRPVPNRTSHRTVKRLATTTTTTKTTAPSFESDWPEPGKSMAVVKPKRSSQQQQQQHQSSTKRTRQATVASLLPTLSQSAMTNKGGSGGGGLKMSDVLAKRISKSESRREQVSPSTSPLRPTAAATTTTSTTTAPLFHAGFGSQSSSSEALTRTPPDMAAFGTPPRPPPTTKHAYSSSRRDTRPCKASFLTRVVRLARSEVRGILADVELNESGPSSGEFTIKRARDQVSSADTSTTSSLSATCVGDVIMSTSECFFFPVRTFDGARLTCCVRTTEERSTLHRLHHISRTHICAGVTLKLHQPYLLLPEDKTIICNGLVEVVE